MYEHFLRIIISSTLLALPVVGLSLVVSLRLTTARLASIPSRTCACRPCIPARCAVYSQGRAAPHPLFRRFAVLC